MIFTYAKAIILVFIVIVGLTYFNKNYFEPFFIEEKGIFGMIEAAAILYFAYAGYDIASTLSEEAINPYKDIPNAIALCVFLCMMLYTMVAVTLTGMSNFSSFN